MPLYPVMDLLADWQQTFASLSGSPRRVERIVSARGLSLSELVPLTPDLDAAVRSLSASGKLPESVRIYRNEYTLPDQEKMCWMVICLMDKGSNIIYQKDCLYRADKSKVLPVPDKARQSR